MHITRKLLIILFVIIIGYLYINLSVSNSFFPKSSQLYYNGHILTMEDSFPIVEALYVENGIIKDIGSENDLRSFTTEKTEFIDLKGQTLLPGFIDSHTHPIASAFLNNMIDLSGFKHDSKEELWVYLEEMIKDFSPNEWILCKGFDQVLIDGLSAPHITYLDSISPNNPLFISSLSMHDYWANSMAFKLAGIDKDTPNPSEFSYYEKDKSGNITGYIVEQEAFKPFKELIIDALGVKILKENSVEILRQYAANGNTSITAMGITTDDPNVMRLYDYLSSNKSTLLNKILSQIGLLPVKEPTVRHFVFIRFDAVELLPKSIVDNDFFKIVGVKFWYDGSPYTGSMYIHDPYLDNNLTNEILHFPHSHSGSPLLNSKVLEEAIEKYQSKGWQIAVHAQGDKAIKEVLDSFEKINYNKKDKEYRHRLEHCLLLNNNSITRMADLDIHPSFHINHLYYYGESLSDNIIGNERTEKILPVKIAEDKSLIYTLHADQPMFDSKPLSLLHTAVNRKTKNGKLIGRHNSVPVISALKALTINGAWQIKMENKIGSIKVGKYADFVLLDKNPLTIPITRLKEINVMRTIVNGKTIFINPEVE